MDPALLKQRQEFMKNAIKSMAPIAQRAPQDQPSASATTYLSEDRKKKAKKKPTQGKDGTTQDSGKKADAISNAANFGQAEEDGKLKYVPPYKVKNRPTLLALLKKNHIEGKGGVLLSELNDCIPQVEQHIKALGDQVVDVPTQINKRKDHVYFYNEPETDMIIESDFVALWRLAGVDHMDEKKIEEYLQKHGINAAKDLAQKRLVAAAPKRKQKRKIPQKTYNGTVVLAVYGAFGAVVWESISAAYGGFVSANSRPSAARMVALSVPTRGLRPLERWLCQCQLAAFGRSNGGFVSANSRPSAARTVALSVPTRGLRPLEWWLCQCESSVLPTFLRYRNLADRCAVCWSFVGPRGAPRREDPQTTNTLHTYLPSS
ncbi:general transcription factor IIE subunit 2 [Ditylenchus destructor]|nr:general transcription factor IIE subunit 2 [Ditylenchus destructor]